MAWASRDPEELLASGFDSLEFGTNPWPNGRSWVSNQYPPFVILGSDHSVFGTAFVSTDPQTLVAGAGEQSSLLTTGIEDRLRVWQRGRMIAGAGDQSSVGLSWISHLDRQILASAPMPFAPTAPRVCSGVRADGVDVESFGEAIADFTEVGKVKRVGAGDQLVTGSAFFSFRISITAGDSSGFGASIAYNSINPIGISDLAFGSSVVAGNGGHVCGQLPRAIPMPASDFSSIGLAGVSNA